MALGAYDAQVSLKMCNASLLDSDNISVLTDQVVTWGSHVLPRKKKIYLW